MDQTGDRDRQQVQPLASGAFFGRKLRGRQLRAAIVGAAQASTATATATASEAAAAAEAAADFSPADLDLAKKAIQSQCAVVVAVGASLAFFIFLFGFKHFRKKHLFRCSFFFRVLSCNLIMCGVCAC